MADCGQPGSTVNTNLGQDLTELAVLVAAVAGYVVLIYCFVLLRWYRPRNGVKHFHLKLGHLTPWLDRHPFVPFPGSLAALLLVLAVLVPYALARGVFLVGAAVCVLAAVRFAVREPAWADDARLYLGSPNSYVPGRAERLEWAAAGLSLAALAAGYFIVAGATAAAPTIAIVIGAVLLQLARGRRRRPRA